MVAIAINSKCWIFINHISAKVDIKGLVKTQQTYLNQFLQAYKL